MSRPSSRLSSGTQYSSQHQQYNQRQHAKQTGETTTSSTNNVAEVRNTTSARSISSSSANATVRPRPHSALAVEAPSHASLARVPFTPGVTGRTSKLAHLGLSAKQVDKLSESIALARGGSRASTAHSTAASNVFRDSTVPTQPPASSNDRRGAAPDRKGKGKASMVPEASFIAETSFVDAPLNSRLVTAGGSPSKPRLTTKQLRQLISQSDADQDDEADLQQLDDAASDDVDANAIPKEDISHADVMIQEALLVEDLISILRGNGAQFISPTVMQPTEAQGQYRGYTYIIDDQMDAPLQALTQKILVLATYHTALSEFVEAYSHREFGLTSHALCSGIRAYLNEYYVLVQHIEEHFESSASFSLQKFYYFAQPTLHQFFLIYHLVQELTTSPLETKAAEDDASGELQEEDSSDDDDRFGGGKAMKEAMRQMAGGTESKAKKAGWSAGGPVKGGEMLAIIDERLQRTSGDPVAHAIYTDLLLKASQPYAHTLLSWVTTGHLQDPYDEFMIKESKTLDQTALESDYTDDYWEKKYTLKDFSITQTASNSGNVDEGGRGLTPSASGALLADRAELVSFDTRSTKRENGLGGGAVVPLFLERRKVKVLLAGKYLNVIRECSSSDLLQTVQKEQEREVPEMLDTKISTTIDMTSEDFQDQIDKAYFIANKALLTLLVERQSLFPRLRSLKHHFFLDHGDSFTHFLDSAANELSKKAKHVSLSKLQSLLDLAIRNPSSASSADPYKEDVKVAMSSMTLVEWLMKIANVKGAMLGEGDADGLPDSAGPGDSKDKAKKEDKHVLYGIDALSLDYTVTFPLSLVISRRALLTYQLIFRHLLALKHIEQTLTSNWLEHTKNPIWRKHTRHIGIEKWKNRVFTLRCRMLAFVQQMYAFAVSEVLEGNWRKMIKRLEGVATVDQLLKYHYDFLETCLTECMLTNPKLLKLQSKLMTTCSLFVSYNSRLTKAANSLTNATEEALERGEEWSTVSVKSEDDFLQKFEINFYRHQKMHSDSVMFHALSDTSSLLPLVVRLANTVPESEGPPT